MRSVEAAHLLIDTRQIDCPYDVCTESNHQVDAVNKDPSLNGSQLDRRHGRLVGWLVEIDGNSIEATIDWIVDAFPCSAQSFYFPKW